MLLMDVKRAFDHVSKGYLLPTIEKMGTDSDLMRNTKSFISARSVGLLIDGHLWKQMTVETEFPLGSPISSTLFAIYLSGVLKQVEQEVEVCMATSFAYNCR